MHFPHHVHGPQSRHRPRRRLKEMEIYYVADTYAESVEFVDEQIFFAKRADAEAELAERVAHLQVAEDKRHERKVHEWRTNFKAVRAVIDAGLPIPYSLGTVTTTAPEKRPVTHSFAIIAVEVID